MFFFPIFNWISAANEFSPKGDDLSATITRAPAALPVGVLPEAPRKITDEERSFDAYHTLRVGRADARYQGIRKIRKAKARVFSLSRLDS